MVKNLPKESYHSSVGQLQDFKESLVWRDMVTEINVWIERARNALEDNLDPTETAHVRGCVRSARDMLNLPDVLIDMVEVQNKEETDGR